MKLILLPAFAMLAGTSQAFNYLENPGFEDWTVNNDGQYSYSFTGKGLGGLCGPNDWEWSNFAFGTTTTARVSPPPGLQDSGNWSAYITSSVAGNGILQVTLNQYFNPDVYNSVSGWVYVTSGSVGIGWFDQANQQLHIVASTSTTGQWVYLSSNLPAVQSSAFMILGLAPGTSFYADNMDADSLPSPEPASLLALGLGAFALRRRKQG